MTMGKESMKDPVPGDLPPTPFLGHSKEQIVVQLGPVHDKEKIVREEEHDYDIPLHDGVMQPLTPHITPPDDDYVAPATNPILDKQLNEFREEFYDITRVAKKAKGNPVNNVKELSVNKEKGNPINNVKELSDITRMSADVARGHDGDGGGDDRPALHQESGQAAYPPGDPEPWVKEDHESTWPRLDPV
ncbi:hypothetical protein Tco_1032353 [Tanacetum coccineum]|uniref:Uncharacterized protein n=1 Tax=Tanacetum coccineum TaxID=301880 RepID=A0ABQ5GBL2_9ASTR